MEKIKAIDFMYYVAAPEFMEQWDSAREGGVSLPDGESDRRFSPWFALDHRIDHFRPHRRAKAQ